MLLLDKISKTILNLITDQINIHKLLILFSKDYKDRCYFILKKPKKTPNEILHFIRSEMCKPYISFPYLKGTKMKRWSGK